MRDGHDPMEEFEGMRDELSENGGKPHDPKERDYRHSYDGPGGLRLGHIAGATNFHVDAALAALGLLAEFLRHPDLSKRLMATAGVFSRGFPEANWPAVLLAYVLSGERAMLAFYSKWGPQVFPLCGFGDWTPSYFHMYDQFVKLEARWEAFVDTLAWLVQERVLKFCPTEGLIGALDSSAAKSPALIHHACLDPAACAAAGGDPTKIHPLVSAAIAEKDRAKEAEHELPDQHDAIERTRGQLVELPKPGGGTARFRELWSRGHRWLTRDLTAGLRKYQTGSSWFGLLVPTFFAAPVGLPLAVYPIPADFPEWAAWPRLSELIRRVLGRLPEIVSVDRGFGFAPFYRYNTYRGIATVGPRRLRSGTRRDDRLTWRLGGEIDEDGHARCINCGGATRHHGGHHGPNRKTPLTLGPYFDASGEPRIRYGCLDPLDDVCATAHSIACAGDWIWLVPLSRLHPLYNDVRFTHQNHEGGFRYLRDRYNVIGKDDSSRLLRAGLGAHRLQLWAALLLDWFRVCLRHGWLDSAGLVVITNPDTIVDLTGIGSALLAQREQRRRDLHTTLPYGHYWQRYRHNLRRRAS